jgi:uncharacterized protein (DUF1499 family)
MRYGFFIVVLLFVSFQARSDEPNAKRDGESMILPPPGQLAPCPDKPNCVSSQSDPSDGRHYMQPIVCGVEPAVALERLKEIVLAMPGSALVSEDDTQMHFTFTTRIMRFVDDVELVIDTDAGLVHFRSASRVGHSDLGVNRKRMKKIVAEWTKIGPS